MEEAEPRQPEVSARKPRYNEPLRSRVEYVIKGPLGISLMVLLAGAVLLVISTMMQQAYEVDPTVQAFTGYAGIVLVLAGAIAPQLIQLMVGSRHFRFGGLLIIVSAGTCLLLASAFLVYGDSPFRRALGLSGGGLIVLGAGVSLYMYLADFRVRPPSRPVEGSALEGAEKEVALDKLGSRDGGSALAERSNPNLREELLRVLYNQARDRLLEEVANLTRRGNVNLVIGGLTTLAAASLLVYIALTMEAAGGDVPSLLRHYLPRLSVVVFVEIFAFFFLRLYRRTLEDIKYFQNEVSNTDARILALEIAIGRQDPDMLKFLVQELAKTERNFRLAKDESTVELERSKVESQTQRELIEALTAFTRK